jgi:DNA-binding NarL/FixJ family response regulator
MNVPKVYTIMIADDDGLVRDGLSMVLEQSGIFQVVGDFVNGRALLLALESQVPDVVLVDVRMPEMTGIECCKVISERYPKLPVLVLTTFQDDEYLSEALKAGAKGYLLKHQSSQAVIIGIQNAIQGNLSFDPDVAKSLSIGEGNQTEDHLSGIPPRELEVLKLLAKGYSNKEISETLYLSPGTVRNYVSSLLDFAGVRDRTQLVIWYYRRGE